MIVKKIRNRKGEKPKSWQIGDLVDDLIAWCATESGIFLRSGRKKARGGRPRFAVWLREQGLRRQAERWRYRAALEQERHSPPPREPEREEGGGCHDRPAGKNAVTSPERRILRITIDSARIFPIEGAIS